MIDPSLFVAEMERRWLEYPMASRPRIVTPGVRQLWREMGDIFNAPEGEAHPVVAAALGSGKTTAMKVWCSILPFDHQHPGVLIVVRQIEDAERVAADINAWAGRDDMAFAYHSALDFAVKQDLAALQWKPTLVICHRGYETSLSQFTMADMHAKFEAMHAFRGDQRRRLVFVDESLDLIYLARLTADEIEKAKAKIPFAVRRAHRRAWHVLESVYDAILAAPTGNDVFTALTPTDLLARADATPDEADAALRAMWVDLRKHKTLDRRVRRKIGDVFEAISQHLAIYRFADGRSAILGSRLLVPPEVSMVILDATATLNPVYQRSKSYSIPALEAVRSYHNAAQYVIRVFGTGIKSMDERGEEYAQETLDQVLAHYGDRASERRVLVVTNKNSEPKVRGVFAAGGFASLDVVHWGDIDGRNDFAHCDTCVTLTLHYGAPGQDRALKNALDGTTPSTEELNDDTDDVRELRELRVAGQLAQALGRTCIRDLTREDGDCEPAEFFTRLPNWDKVVRTDVILEYLRRVLPGLRQVELSREAMTDWAGTYGHHFATAGLLAWPPDVPKRTWMRVLKDAKDATNGQIGQEMKRAGLELVRAGSRVYIQPAGVQALPSSAARIVDFATGLTRGAEAPLSACGLSERARLRAIKLPDVKTLLTALGVTVERRAPRDGGIVLVRAV